jgi:hypothetical protein
MTSVSPPRPCSAIREITASSSASVVMTPSMAASIGNDDSPTYAAEQAI